MKRFTIVLLCSIVVIGCSKRGGLSSDDAGYVSTTLDLMRTRANIKPGMDSAVVKSMLDTVYRRHHTSRADYLAQTSAFGGDPKHAEAVYNAIKDSVGIK
jgi:hypothetical protein